MNKRKFISLVVMFLVVGCVFLFGCSRVNMLVSNTRKNIKLNEALPVYDLNKKNFKEISYEGRTYEILEEAFKGYDLDKPIGRVSQRVTFDENNSILDRKELVKIYVIPDGSEQKRFDLNFGWIYSVKNTDSDKIVAVVVNEKYRKAVIKK